MSTWLRRVTWLVVLAVPLGAGSAGDAPAKRRPGAEPKAEEVGALGRRTFASVEQVYEWTVNYTGCCGCTPPVVLKRGDKEAVVVVCTRTSGPLTSETFVFDRHENGYRFMLLRNLLYQGLTVRDEGEEIVLAGESPILRIPWSGVGAR